MFHTLKNWMSGLVLFALIAAQVVPAFALSIAFQTAAEPPTILSSYPAPYAENVELQPAISVTFNMPVGINADPTTVFHKASDNSIVSSSIATVGYNSDKTIITVTCLQPLLGSTQYYLDLNAVNNYPATPTQNLRDNQTIPGNVAYCTTGSPRLYFTTVENLAPQWDTKTYGSATGTALAGATTVPINTSFFIKTTKALNPVTINTTNIKLYKGAVGDFSTEVSITPTLDGTGKIITVAPGSNLLYGTWYHLELTNVADTQANILQ